MLALLLACIYAQYTCHRREQGNVYTSQDYTQTQVPTLCTHTNFIVDTCMHTSCKQCNKIITDAVNSRGRDPDHVIDKHTQAMNFISCQLRAYKVL